VATIDARSEGGPIRQADTEAISLSREEYRALVEQAPIMIWRSNTAGLCNYFNERWLAFTGRTLLQEAGNGWAEGVHPEDFQQCLRTYLEAFAKREIFEMKYRLRRHDGLYRWIFDRGVPFYTSQGGFAGYIGSCIDITERVEAQEALEQSRQAELNDLRGLLPICVSCKKIRDDHGYWQRLETYICAHSRAEFSHGLCPACADRLYAEF
jgi:PAS domain S-box-containing protein